MPAVRGITDEIVEAFKTKLRSIETRLCASWFEMNDITSYTLNIQYFRERLSGIEPEARIQITTQAMSGSRADAFVKFLSQRHQKLARNTLVSYRGGSVFWVIIYDGDVFVHDAEALYGETNAC